MLDYRLHFAALVAEDHLRDAHQRRARKGLPRKRVRHLELPRVASRPRDDR